MTERQHHIDELCRQGDVSVLIVGGGINGTGLLRELALQGVDAVLVDKADFCSGASAGCTRMIHGGLRYMEFGEFRLVRESLRDRNALLRNAPHYVAALATTIPLFKRISGAISMARRFFHLGGTRSAHRGSLMVRVGLTLYDIFTWKSRLMPKHRFTSRRKALARRPLLHPDIIGTATYYDAYITYAERLGLELVLDAEALGPHARALNYVSLQGAVGGVVQLRDELSDRTFEVTPKVLVNATGAWIDFTNRTLGRQTKLIGGTKGAHLVLDNDDLYETLQGEMIYYETAEGRVAVALPWLGKCLIGSTDIRVGNPDDVRCEEDEVDYMLDSIRQVLPELDLTREHVVSRFTGVRPLRYSDEDATGSVSRSHYCAVIEPGDGVDFPVYAMTGGKWTTFRAFAEQVTDQLLARLGLARSAGSQDLPIGGGKDFPPDQARRQWVEALAGSTHLPRQRLETLLERYGTRAEQVARFLAEQPDRPMRHHAGYTRREIEYIFRRERVVHVDDLLIRRTAIALLGELTDGLLAELVAIMAELHGWSRQQARDEAARGAAILKDKFGITVQCPAGDHAGSTIEQSADNS